MAAIFIKIHDADQKGKSLRDSIKKLNSGIESSNIFFINLSVFKLIPKTPFSYWVSKEIRQIFVNVPSLEGNDKTAKQGLATADDFRFVKLWWEIDAEKILSGNPNLVPEDFRELTDVKKWVPFAKGGEYSPYYADLYLVINWEKNGYEIKNWADGLYNNSGWSRIIKSVDYYFKTGITWSLRTQLGFTSRPLVAGAIFAHKGPAIIVPDLLKFSIVAITNSSTFLYLLSLQMAFGSYEVGVIQRTPLPEISDNINTQLSVISREIIKEKCQLSKHSEISHLFYKPLFCNDSQISLSHNFTQWKQKYDESSEIISQYQIQINNIVCDLYGIPFEYHKIISNASENLPHPLKNIIIKLPDYTSSLLSYLLGCIFGRWDIRYATGEKDAPDLPDPFDPLPTCSPGMLQGEDGLPLLEQPKEYPLSIDADGILVDDERYQDDIVIRIQSAMQVIWGSRSEETEKEVCTILKTKDLRTYFRKDTKGGFWDDHLTRYSNSRRTAPIYLLLQSDKKNYSVWIYYHRYDHDTLFKVLERYVKPKIYGIERRVDELIAKKSGTPQTDPSYKKILLEIEEQEDLLAEINRFSDRIQKIADLSLVPDLDDGVVLTISPLREVIPWKDLADYWKELLEGKYEWSSIGKQLREKGMVNS